MQEKKRKYEQKEQNIEKQKLKIEKIAVLKHPKFGQKSIFLKFKKNKLSAVRFQNYFCENSALSILPRSQKSGTIPVR